MFHEVFILLLHLHLQTVNLSTKDDVLHPRIANNTKYFPYFQDCLGALDNTYIPAHVPVVNSAAYQNWKRTLSQTV